MILQFFLEIQGYPYPLQRQNPVKGMDSFTLLYEKNHEPSIMLDEKNPAGTATPFIGGTDKKCNGPIIY